MKGLHLSKYVREDSFAKAQLRITQGFIRCCWSEAFA